MSNSAGQGNPNSRGAFLAADWASQSKDAKLDGPIACSGLSTTQLEELYAFFKAKDSREPMSSKKFSAVAIQWFLDSGASLHMTSNPHIVQNLTKLLRPILLRGKSELLLLAQI